MPMKTVNVAVSDLLLWEKNPRVATGRDQKESLNNIYNSGSAASARTSQRQLMNLVESIAVNGYQNEIEPIIVVAKDGENGKYVVQDANRRLSAIMLLSDPEKYEDILEDKDYEKVLKLSEEYKDNIPKMLEVVVFPNTTDDEKTALREVLARKHNGPMDGAGTVPWGTEAKDRFFNRSNSFTDHLEGAFAQQYEQNLTDYLGGSNSVTSTRRIFDSKIVKGYLNIKDLDDISQDELEKVKNLADEVKAYAREHNIIFSRFRSEDLKSIINPEREKGINNTELNFKRVISLSRQEFLRRQITKRDRVLGYRWLQPTFVNLDDMMFEEVNMLLLGLSEYGDLKGDADKRLLKAYLLAPAIRSFFELSLQALEKGNYATLEHGVSRKHKDNVRNVHENHLKNKKFYQYLDDNGILFDSYTEAESVIEGTDFAETAYRANSTAHKSMKNILMNDFLSWFNDAVLFAMLCEQYAKYRSQDSETGTAGQN